jgi:hypothetical protein
MSGIFRFFLALLEKVAEFGHPGSTGKIRVLEDFRFFDDFSGFLGFLIFLRILPKVYGIFVLLRKLTEYIAI